MISGLLTIKKEPSVLPFSLNKPMLPIKREFFFHQHIAMTGVQAACTRPFAGASFSLRLQGPRINRWLADS
jgi:hypothetical protein